MSGSERPSGVAADHADGYKMQVVDAGYDEQHEHPPLTSSNVPRSRAHCSDSLRQLFSGLISTMSGA